MRRLAKNSKNYYFLTLFFFCSCILLGEMFFIITENLLYLTSFFIVGFVLIFIRQILIGNLYSLYTFYLLTSAFFMYDKFILGPCLGKGVMSIDFAGTYSFPDWVGEKFVFIASVSIVVVDFVYTTHKVKGVLFKWNESETKIHTSDSTVKTDDFYLKVGLIIMCVFIFPILYKIVLQIQHQKTFANYAIANFTGQEDTTHYPWWTKGSGVFFYIGFLFFIYSFPPVKKAKYGYILYFLMMFTTALKGGRAFFFTYILTMPLLYKKIYGKTMSKFAMFSLTLLLIAMGIFLGNFRSNISTKVQKGILAEFLYGQTTTMGVPYVYLENHGNIPYKQYPFILTYLVNPIRKHFIHANRGSIEYLKQSNNYGSIALYLINPNLLKVGGGLGLNFLTEAYDFFGVIGVVFWSAILAVVIKLVDFIKYSNKNRWLIVTLFFVYQYTLFLPRHSFFGITDHIKYIIIFYAVYLIIQNRKILFGTSYTSLRGKK